VDREPLLAAAGWAPRAEAAATATFEAAARGWAAPGIGPGIEVTRRPTVEVTRATVEVTRRPTLEVTRASVEVTRRPTVEVTRASVGVASPRWAFLVDRLGASASARTTGRTPAATADRRVARVLGRLEMPAQRGAHRAGDDIGQRSVLELTSLGVGPCLGQVSPNAPS
jgi:hypothetical protein